MAESPPIQTKRPRDPYAAQLQKADFDLAVKRFLLTLGRELLPIFLWVERRFRRG